MGLTEIGRPSIVAALLLATACSSCGSSHESGNQDASSGADGPTYGDSGSDAAATLDSGDSGHPSDATTATDASPEGGDAAALPSIAGFVAGTNLSGAEFGNTIPGVYGTDYTYPTHAEVDYFTGKGFRIFRFPFLWERMQLALGQPLAPTQLGYLTDIVSYATSKGAYALIDPHNYARYDGLVIGSTSDAGPTPATGAQFGQFWSELASAFASNPHVVFGL